MFQGVHSRIIKMCFAFQIRKGTNLARAKYLRAMKNATHLFIRKKCVWCMMLYIPRILGQMKLIFTNIIIVLQNLHLLKVNSTFVFVSTFWNVYAVLSLLSFLRPNLISCKVSTFLCIMLMTVCVSLYSHTWIDIKDRYNFNTSASLET